MCPRLLDQHHASWRPVGDQRRRSSRSSQCNALRTSIRTSCRSGWEGSRRLIKHPGSLRLGWGAETAHTQAGARNKRCRQARPLTGRLDSKSESDRSRTCAHQCRTRSLSARSAQPTPSRAASPAPLACRNAGSGNKALAKHNDKKRSGSYRSRLFGVRKNGVCECVFRSPIVRHACSHRRAGSSCSQLVGLPPRRRWSRRNHCITS